jgi:hypothetical protein
MVNFVKWNKSMNSLELSSCRSSTHFIVYRSHYHLNITSPPDKVKCSGEEDLEDVYTLTSNKNYEYLILKFSNMLIRELHNYILKWL